jgi:hypothetical protein
MDYTGLIFEFIFLGMGIYLYLFSIGKVKPSNPETKERGEAFRKANQGWMRIGSLALIAIMTINIVLHLKDLLG